ncbi:MAG: Hsp20 family protein [Rhodothalassiaceae bacterium]
MRNFDLTPLLRSSVGFDDLFRLADSLGNFEREPAYPPYNIERLSEDDYRIEMAVAGFSPDELVVEVQDNALKVYGRAAEETDERTYLHRGIAKRAFERTFRLADTIRVNGARFEHGLLIVDLVREIPEHKKPRQIAIQTGETEATAVTDKRAAA